MKCPKCNSENVILTPKGTATQASCGVCGHFIKWANKDDIRLIQTTQPPTPITQGDRIRKMDNHELAKQFVSFDIHTNRAMAKHAFSDYPTIDAAIEAEEKWLNSQIEGEQK